MMSVIHRCPHCDKDLPGWQPPYQVTAWPVDSYVTTTNKRWQLCPLCNGSGVEKHNYSTTTSTCTFCCGKKVVATP